MRIFRELIFGGVVIEITQLWQWRPECFAEYYVNVSRSTGDHGVQTIDALGRSLSDDEEGVEEQIDAVQTLRLFEPP